MKYLHSNTRYSYEIDLDFTTPIELVVNSFEHPYNEVLEKDDNEVCVSNKIPKIIKSLANDFIVYHMNHTRTSIIEVYASLDVDDWKEIDYNEKDLIISNRKWELFELSFGSKPIIHATYKGSQN